MLGGVGLHANLLPYINYILKKLYFSIPVQKCSMSGSIFQLFELFFHKINSQYHDVLKKNVFFYKQEICLDAIKLYINLFSSQEILSLIRCD